MELGNLGLRHTWRITCRRKGAVVWIVEKPNLIMNEGLDEILNKFYGGTNYTAALKIGLVNNTGFSSFTSVDTALQISTDGSKTNAWREFIDYKESVRQDFVAGASSGQSLDNTLSPASFEINMAGVIQGAFMVATDDVKGGTTGVLMSGVSFDNGDQNVQVDDVLGVDMVATASSV